MEGIIDDAFFTVNYPTTYLLTVQKFWNTLINLFLVYGSHYLPLEKIKVLHDVNGVKGHDNAVLAQIQNP